MKLTDNQALAAAPYMGEGFMFVGQLMGIGKRDWGFQVKDKDKKPTGEFKQVTTSQFVVMIQPEEGIPIPLICEFAGERDEHGKDKPAREVDPSWKMKTVLAIMKEVVFNKYENRNTVICTDLFLLDAPAAPAKTYPLKTPANA